MGKFKTKLRVESDGKYWKLLEPLIFESAKYGVIRVPTGFRTDFASVPRIPLVYSLFGNTSHNAAVVHDWLYSGRAKISRKGADEVFIEAMKCKKQSKWRREPMFWAVRLFAGLAFKGKADKKI
jgi:hypothetical protein